MTEFDIKILLTNRFFTLLILTLPKIQFRLNSKLIRICIKIIPFETILKGIDFLKILITCIDYFQLNIFKILIIS